MTVAVVILNWNGLELLKQFLPTVVKHSPNTHIYVADNLSTDVSKEYVSTAFPEVTWIQNQENLGYAGGYQEALKQVSEDLYILLNSDVEVTPGWIQPHLDAFMANPRLVATQPKIKDYHRKEYFEYAGAAGGYIDKYGFPYCRGRVFDTLEKDIGQYDQAVPIFWASGACLVVKNKAYWEAGGLDPCFFAHQEEIDLCWRMLQNNAEIYVIPSSVVYHIGGATLDKSSSQKTYYNFRNSLFAMYKNLTARELIPIIFIRLCMDGMAGIRFLIQGKSKHCWAIVKAHFGFYRQIPNLREKRKKIIHKHIERHPKLLVKAYFINKIKTFNLLKRVD